MIDNIINLFIIYISITLIFSILVSLSTYNIFKYVGVNTRYSFIPIINLIYLLYIVKLKKYLIVLLFIPFISVFIIYYILYRLSVMFGLSRLFTFGLIFFAIVFLPLLNVKYTTKKEKKEVVEDTIEEEKVDNIFKKEVKIKDEVPLFKANQIKYKEMMLDGSEKEKTKRLDMVEIKPLNKEEIIENDILEIEEIE